MSDPDFLSERFHSVVISATARTEKLPALDGNIESTWWRDFVAWLDKQFAPLNIGPLNIEWLGSLLSVLAWIIGISLSLYILFRLAKFYFPRVLTPLSRLSESHAIGTDKFELQQEETPRSQLRGLWRTFLVRAKLARATTPLEFWQGTEDVVSQPLSPQWLYQRMFGPSVPSSEELKMAAQQLEAISKERR